MRTWTKRELDEAVADFVWSQWTQAGLAGVARRRDRWAIDLEALYLFSVRFAPREARLFGELLDWLRTNARLMSVKRLRNLTHDEWSRKLVEACILWAGIAPPATQRRARRTGASSPKALEALADLYVSTPDPAFAAFGFLWPETPASGKSLAPDVSQPINLSFRLRLLLGVSSRAEILRYLLTTEDKESSTSEIAHASGFGKRIINEALPELVESGVIEGRREGRELAYRLDTARWAAFLELSTRSLPKYVDWIRLLSVLWEMVRWFDEDSTTERSEYLRASEARRLVQRIQADLLAAGVRMPDDRGAHGAHYWPVFMRTVEATLQMLNPAA